MRTALAFFAAALCLLPFSSADAGEVSPFKECATLRNAAEQEVMGVIRTNYYKFKGQVDRHEGHFDLQDGEHVEICSTGPFFDDYKVELTIKTIMPLFTCKTRLSGEIVIRKKEQDGVNLLYADCK